MKYSAISLIGKPNVGKSTIINKIFNEQVSIVNMKPQTTRNQIAKICENSDYKILFVDTPGFHLEKNELDKFLNGEIYRALKLCPIIFLISDLSRDFSNEDEIIVKKIQKLKDKKIILLLNKSDLVDNSTKQSELLSKYEQYLEFYKVYLVNQNEFDINKILHDISNLFEDHEDLINFIENNLDDKFIIKEIIRNVILRLLKQEVPYSVAINVIKDKYNDETKSYNIETQIIVDKESHKPILIGKQGRMIKQIGIDSRIDLAKIYNCNINLFLDVKVKQNWKNNLNDLKELGYIIKK